MSNRFPDSLTRMRSYYATGATRTYQFRKEQLMKLKNTLHKYEGEIYNALNSDLGKSREEAYGTELGLVYAELNYALKNFKEWMEPQRVETAFVNMPSSGKIYRDSLGVILIIAPWNYPLNLIFIPLVGAIAGGNCIVLKPSEHASATSVIVDKIISETFSPDYIKVVLGEGIKEIPDMMNSFRFDHVLFTGSTSVGRSIYKMAAEKLIPVTLEMGGKSPGIIEADANIHVAARRLVMGKFLNNGQICIAPDYLLVHTSVKDKLVKEIIKSIEKFYSSDTANNKEYGKIINEKRFDKLVSYLRNGTIIYGGKHDRDKLWIEPTLMENVPLDSLLMTEEVFGPLLPILSFDSTSEALTIVNQNPNPLAFYLFTSSKKRERFWMENVHFGGGCINNTAWHFANKEFPFGGVGQSGIGAYHGKHSFNRFTREKPVMKSATWFDPDFKYPPMKGKMKLFKMFIK